MTTLIPLFDTPDGASWRQSNAHLFASNTSLRWWWRQHKLECIQAGAAFLHNGKWCAAEPAMTNIVLAIARQNAERAVEVNS